MLLPSSIFKLSLLFRYIIGRKTGTTSLLPNMELLPKRCPKCRAEGHFYDERSGGTREGHCFSCLSSWHLCLGRKLVTQANWRKPYGTDAYRCPSCLGNPDRQFPGPLSRYLQECPSCGGRVESRCNCPLKERNCSRCPARWHVCTKLGKLVMKTHADALDESEHVRCECI